jgi:tetratricopeptide (TPR) repeat protein
MAGSAAGSQPPRGAGLPPRFTSIRRLGAGGFGVVLEVEDQSTQSRLALKRLERVDPASIYRFKQEFRVLAGRRHQNLVRLHDLFSDAGTWSFTMELVDGVPFDAWVWGTALTGSATLAPESTNPLVDSSEEVATVAMGSDELPSSRTGPLELPRPPEAAPPTESGVRGGGPPEGAIARLRAALPQLVRGVLALHEDGILHRDLKPSNVLVDRSGTVKILDFGLALASTGSDPADAARAGTPTYMSPEQARGAALTMASDWYSVGVMLYEVLVGRPPFGGTAANVLSSKRSREPRDPRSLAGGLPNDLCDLCMELLRRDPAERPTGPAIARRVGLSASTAASPRHVLDGTFVGRERESRALHDAFEQMRRGRTVVAHVVGRSGLGKTALVRRFAADLALSDEIVLLEGRCFERELVPFKALDELVDALGRYLGRLKPIEAAGFMPRDAQALIRLFPSLGRLEFLGSVRGRTPSADLYELRRQAFGAFREILARLSDTRPVVLILDDVHWGDRDSADLIRNLLAPPDVPPLLLVACYRSGAEESNDLLRILRTPQAMDRAWDVVEVPIGPLPPNDAVDLARRLLAEGTASGVEPAVLAEEGARSPLLIAELVRAANRRTDGARGVSIGDVVQLRRARLTPEAVALLELLAGSDRPLTLGVLARALGRSAPETAEILELLRQEHLATVAVSRAEPAFEIFHDRIRRTLLELVHEDRRVAIHTALAEALVATDADPEIIYRHYSQSRNAEAAASWAERAGDRAALGTAFDQAADLYAAAVAHADERLGPDNPVRRKLARALAHAGRGDEAAESYLVLSRSGAPDAEVFHRHAGQQLLRAGRIEEGMATLGEALTQAGLPSPKTPRSAVASLLWRRARLRLRGLGYRERPAAEIPERQLHAVDLCWALSNGLTGIDVVRSAHYYALGLWLALESGDPRRVARSLAAEGALSALENVESAARAETVIARAEELARQHDDAHALGWAMAGRALQCFTRTELERCVEYCEEAIRYLRERSEETFREIGSIEVWFALHAAFLLGRLDRVAARAPACAREAEMRGDRYTASTVRAYVLPLLWAARGQPEEGRADADRAIAVWPAGTWYHQHWAHLRAHCFLDLYDGRGNRILERTRDGRPKMKSAMHTRLRTPRLELNYLEGRGALEELRLAHGASRSPAATPARELRRLVDDRIRRLMAERSGLASVYGKTLEAGLLALTAPESASPAFDQLARSFEELSMPLHEAAARLRAREAGGGRATVHDGHSDPRESLTRRGVADVTRFVDMLVPRLVEGQG